MGWLKRSGRSWGGGTHAQAWTRFLGPLGMDSTAFMMSDEQRADSVPIHVRGDDGTWQATDVD